MKNVIIADDHPIVRQGIKRIFSYHDEYLVVGEASSIPELRQLLKHQQADVLILDISMPGGVGLEMLKEIKHDYPKLSVLILSMHSENEYGFRSFKAGAMGYLAKSCASEKLIEALQVIMAGKSYFSTVTLDLIFNKLETKASSDFPHHNLSEREFYVLTMLGQGVSLTQISKDLLLSVQTVSTYRQRVLVKMQMKTNAQLVRYVATNSLSLLNEN